MFKPPTLLPYPEIADAVGCAEIRGVFCYVVDVYEPGIAVVIKLQDGDSGIVIGGWDGKHVSPNDEIWEQSQEFLTHSAYMFIQAMQRIGINQAEFFISSDGILVDVQLSLNKFIGPGMLRDIFSDISKTQNVKEISVLDDDKIKELSTSGNYVLKPSRYRYYARDDDSISPLYARI